MPRRSRTRPTFRAAVAWTIVSGFLLLSPHILSNGLGSLLQVLVPLQHLLSWVAPGPQDATRAINAEEAAGLHDTIRRYENRVAAMQTRIAELEQLNQELSGLRALGLHGGRLIPASVVAADSLPWRESKLIDQGALAGVKRGGAVTSRLLVRAGRDAAVREGLSVLSGEVLVGQVEHVSTHTSRIVLLTDPAAGSRLVRIARRAGDDFKCVPAEFVLHGIGAGRMEVRDVSHAYVDNQQIKPGDIVLASASDDRVPVPLVVGRVTEIRRSDDNGVLYNLIAEPAVDASRLRRMWVLDHVPSPTGSAVDSLER